MQELSWAWAECFCNPTGTLMKGGLIDDTLKDWHRSLPGFYTDGPQTEMRMWKRRLTLMSRDTVGLKIQTLTVIFQQIKDLKTGHKCWSGACVPSCQLWPHIALWLQTCTRDKKVYPQLPALETRGSRQSLKQKQLLIFFPSRYDKKDKRTHTSNSAVTFGVNMLNLASSYVQ